MSGFCSFLMLPIIDVPRSIHSLRLQNSDNKILSFCFHMLSGMIFIRRHSSSTVWLPSGVVQIGKAR